MEKQTRIPRQKRSLEKQQLLLDTAAMLFGRQGYYNTTTNQIAKTAGVSIGSLYAYFADREAILLALLAQYNQSFDAVFAQMQDTLCQHHFRQDRESWSRTLLDLLVSLHRQQLPLAKELRALTYQVPAVAGAVAQQQQQVKILIAETIQKWQIPLPADQADSAATVILDCYTAVVDRVVFGDTPQPEQLLDTAAQLMDGLLDKLPCPPPMA